MESVALGVFGAHKQGVGTLSPTHRRLRQPLRRQRCTARPRFTRPAWPRRALRLRHQRDSGETRFFTFFGNFWLTIQNTANRQVRNLFLEVSWLYLSRFPGALKKGPNPWLLGLGVLSSPFVCLYLCFHRAATGLAVAAAVCCCSAAAEKKTLLRGGKIGCCCCTTCASTAPPPASLWLLPSAVCSLVVTCWVQKEKLDSKSICMVG